MKKTLIALFALGMGACAGATPRHGTIVDRGTVESEGVGAHHIVQGPNVLHGYVESRGASVYLVPSSGDSAADCKNAKFVEGAEFVRVEKGERLELHVPAQTVACFVSQNPHETEMMWHAHAEPMPHGTAVAHGQGGVH